MIGRSKNTLLILAYLSIALLSYSQTVSGQRKDIHHMMYKTFKNAAMCFRILNGTNQFGCSTTQSGSTGIIYLVKNQEDIQWLLETGNAAAGPYMAVLSPKLFTKEVMFKLRDSPQVSGVLLALNGSDERPKSMSPDDTCPNRYASLSGSCDDSKPWNPLGSGFILVDWTKPLFIVRDSQVLQEIEDCFNNFNLKLSENQEGRSLCSLQMTGHMFAAVDTPTCLRRNSYLNSINQITFCDPMGDQNLVSFLFPRQAYTAAPKNSVVLVTARMDAAAMFDGLSPGAVTTVTSLVTLLTTAHLVSQLLPQHKEYYTKNIVFVLLNGEAQEYIGSSRVVYDMQHERFPSTNAPVLLEHLDEVIDLHQLNATKQIYCHCLNTNTAQNTLDTLRNVGKTFDVVVEGAGEVSKCSSTRLPPSSLHPFLKASSSVPGLILTNHQGPYTNMFYNGLFDDSVNVEYQYANGSQVPPEGIQDSLAKISLTLAITLAQLVDGAVTQPSNMTVGTTATLVDELLHCYLESRQCKLFHEVAGTSVVGEEEGPLPLYVGVSRVANQITSATYLVLANLTGTLTNVSEKQCSNKMGNYSYVWITGDQPDSGYCLETGLFYTAAVSPAFIIDNYNWTSGVYSTWTESVWQELSLRMFLKPSFSQELRTLILGLFVLFVSFVSVYWVSHNAEELFNPVACDHC